MWPMPYFAKVCHIIRIDVKSKDFGTALAMWESWHRCAHRPTCINKSIKPTTPASHSPKQVFFYCLSPLSLPRKCFFIAWVNLAPEQSRWSRLGHQVSNGGASMPNASQVNLARVLAYIVEGRYSPLLYYLVFSIKFWPYIYVRKCQCMSLKITPFEIMFKYESNDIVLSDMH